MCSTSQSEPNTNKALIACPLKYVITPSLANDLANRPATGVHKDPRIRACGRPSPYIGQEKTVPMREATVMVDLVSPARALVSVTYPPLVHTNGGRFFPRQKRLPRWRLWRTGRTSERRACLLGGTRWWEYPRPAWTTASKARHRHNTHKHTLFEIEHAVVRGARRHQRIYDKSIKTKESVCEVLNSSMMQRATLR